MRFHDQAFEALGLIRLLSPDLILFATDMNGLTQEKLQFIIASNEQSKNVPILFITHMDPQALCRQLV